MHHSTAADFTASKEARKRFRALKAESSKAVYYVGYASDPNTRRRVGKHGYTVVSNWPGSRKRQIENGLRKWPTRHAQHWTMRFTKVIELRLHEARALEKLVRESCNTDGVERFDRGHDYYSDYDSLLRVALRTARHLGLKLSSVN